MAQVKDLLLHALRLERNGQFEESEQICNQVIAASPDNLPALILLGRSLRRQGRLDDEEKHLAHAFKLSPDTPQLLSELGSLALIKPDPAAAITFLGKLVELEPDKADAHFNFAHALDQALRPADAVKYYERALELGARDQHEIYTRLASARLMQGDIDTAVKDFNIALENVADYAPAHFGRGLAEAALGDLDMAIASFRTAVSIDPGFADAWQQIAESKKFTDPDDPDLSAIEKLLAEKVDDTSAREKLSFALGKIYSDLGSFDAAFAQYQKANELKRIRLPAFDPQAFSTHIDEITTVFTEDRSTPVAQSEKDPPQIVFIVGMPRSGTSLLEQILSSHSQVAGGGENPCIESLTRTLLAPYPSSMANADETALYRARQLYFESLPTDTREAGIFTDKYPANFLHCGLISALFPNTKIIHSRRRAEDTCLSIYFQDFPVGNQYANRLGDIAAYHKQYRRIMDHWRRILPDRIIDIDYEELVADPEGQIRRLLEFLELPWEADCLNFSKTRRTVSTLSRWQVRQPMYQTSVAKWKNYEQHIGSLLEALKK